MINLEPKDADMEPGRKHHRMAVENLAQNMHRPVEGVSVLYGIVLRRFWRTARNKHFLSALVAKRVKELLMDDTPPSSLESRRHGSEI